MERVTTKPATREPAPNSLSQVKKVAATDPNAKGK